MKTYGDALDALLDKMLEDKGIDPAQFWAEVRREDEERRAGVPQFAA